MTGSILRQAVLLVIVAGVSGCVTSRAQIPEQPPTLVVPPVPPRAIEPPVIVELPAEPAPVEPAPTPVSTNKPPRTRPAVDTSKPDPKQEPPPDSGATVPTPPPVQPLRSAATPSGPEATRQIREILDTTQKMLDKVDPQTLSDDRKAHYTSAKDFIRQAEDALKKEELTQARLFAERAQNFAKQLQSGR